MSQQLELERVSTRIAAALVHFCKRHVGELIRADDLRVFVTRNVGDIAPGSADRVLRDLRQRGVISYTVVSRRHSLYLVNRVTS
jgi:hypothetical protein